MGVRKGSALAALRTQIARIEGRSRRGRSVLPFGIRQLDARLPGRHDQLTWYSWHGQ